MEKVAQSAKGRTTPPAATSPSRHWLEFRALLDDPISSASSALPLCEFDSCFQLLGPATCSTLLAEVRRSGPVQRPYRVGRNDGVGPLFRGKPGGNQGFHSGSRDIRREMYVRSLTNMPPSPKYTSGEVTEVGSAAARTAGVHLPSRRGEFRYFRNSRGLRFG